MVANIYLVCRYTRYLIWLFGTTTKHPIVAAHHHRRRHRHRNRRRRRRRHRYETHLSDMRAQAAALYREHADREVELEGKQKASREEAEDLREERDALAIRARRLEEVLKVEDEAEEDPIAPHRCLIDGLICRMARTTILCHTFLRHKQGFSLCFTSLSI